MSVVTTSAILIVGDVKAAKRMSHPRPLLFWHLLFFTKCPYQERTRNNQFSKLVNNTFPSNLEALSLSKYLQ